MVDRLLADLEKSLDNDCYFAALSLALALPDICGRAEYPELSSYSKKRYIQWYDKYIGKYEKPPKESENDEDMPYLSGEVIYQLRCSLLHQGVPDIDKGNIKAQENKIDHFSLVVQKKNDFDAYCDAASVCRNNESPDKERSYRINVRRFCLIVSRVVKSYYEDNKDKFDFMNCNVIDWDAVTEKMYRLSHPYEEV